jgi:hypothetical protein
MRPCYYRALCLQVLLVFLFVHKVSSEFGPSICQLYILVQLVNLLVAREASHASMFALQAYKVKR